MSRYYLHLATDTDWNVRIHRDSQCGHDAVAGDHEVQRQFPELSRKAAKQYTGNCESIGAGCIGPPQAYSCRSTTLGMIVLARIAGTSLASRATIPSTVIVAR